MIKEEDINSTVQPVTSQESSRRPLRVCVVEFLGHGGLVHYAYQMCSALSAGGVDVELITDRDYELESCPHTFPVVKLLNLWNPRPRGKVEWKDGLQAKSARVFRRASRAAAYYRAWVVLIRYILKNRPDIVQFGEIRFTTDFFPLAALRASGIRLADVCHNIAPFNIDAASKDVLKTTPLHQRAFSRIYKLFDVIFVHSEVNRGEFLKLYGGDGSGICVIPHGNEGLFTADGQAGNADDRRKRLDIPPNAPVALFFGTLTKYKGLEVLIEAFREVVNSLPEARLVIAGFPNPDVDVEHLKKQIREYNLDSSVIFHLEYVPVEDVAAFFEISDVVVLPYLMIFQSGALQVAYSFGKPVVATAVGGLKEAVEDGKTGLLVPPRDSPALAKAIIEMLSDTIAASRMGARAKELSETVYSWESIARRVKDSYSKICRKH
jgi:glycosyltransferase involved in cell wall biosynthesis